MSPGFSESMRKLHEPCGARLVADVAHALLRAVSRLISTPALLFDTVCESCARTRRRDESRRGTHECVRHEGMLTNSRRQATKCSAPGRADYEQKKAGLPPRLAAP